MTETMRNLAGGCWAILLGIAVLLKKALFYTVGFFILVSIPGVWIKAMEFGAAAFPALSGVFWALKWLGVLAFIGWFLSVTEDEDDDSGGDGGGGRRYGSRRVEKHLKWRAWYSFK